jgi:GNAT superfamily N-acetyltransferase
MARPAGPVDGDGAPPAELSIEQVTDVPALLTFEATAAQGFESGAVDPHTWHGPDVLTDSRLRMWVGRRDDRPVAVAMAFADAGVLGVYGVATIPMARRRGYATALTAHAVSSAPELPAVLQPSRVAEPLYRRLGFQRFGVFRSWGRAG